MTPITRFLALSVLFFLMACSQPEPTPMPTDEIDPSARAGAPRLLAAPALAKTQPVRFGAVTKRAQLIHNDHRIVAGSGHLVTFSLGTSGTETRKISFAGAVVPDLMLKPGVWQRVQIWAKEAEVAIKFEGGPLYLAQPHLFDPDSDKVPNVLLISVDTLRADYFSKEHMPRTHALFAKDGHIFDAAYTPTTWTLPAHTSLLSGLYPSIHGVRNPEMKVSEKVRTLAEHLREIGYYTAAFTEGNYVSASYGLDQGFLHYHENPPVILGGTPEEMSKLEGTLAALTKHKRDLGDMPQFYFLHTYEVHCPYVPHGDLTDEEGVGSTQWLLDNDGKELKPETLAKLKELYAGEVTYTDGKLADLIESITAEGDWLVVLTSDHGEEFGEHGGLLHADTVYEETARIPLAMMGPGVVRDAAQTGPVSLVDVPTTILGALRLPVPEAFQGRHLFTNETEERAVFAESFYFSVHIPSEDPMVSGVWRDHHKLIHYRNFGKDEISLFDLATDPGEQTNLQQDQVRERNALFGLLKSYMSLKSSDVEKIENMTQEQIEAMRSLGYLK